jgi:hypothetical protein
MVTWDGIGPHDSFTCPALLLERQTPSSQSGGVGGEEPWGVRVLLANPRWERRFVKFLELSEVGKVVADGADEDGAHAARMDEWVAWETVDGGAPRGEG